VVPGGAGSALAGAAGAAQKFAQDYDEVYRGGNGPATARFADGHTKWVQDGAQADGMMATQPGAAISGVVDRDGRHLSAGFGGGNGPTTEDVNRYARGAALEDFKRKVVHTAELSVHVRQRLEALQDEISARVRKDGGYVENATLTAPEKGDRTAEMALRVPVDRFDGTVSWLASLGEVKAKNVRGEDVTGTWVDQRAEIRALRREEERLSKQLSRTRNEAERAGIRSALIQVRPRIAAAEERFAATGKLAALSSIQLTLSESQQARAGGMLIPEMQDTFRSAVAAFLVALRIPATLLIWLAVFSPLWLPCVLVYRWAGRAARQARAGSAEGFGPVRSSMH
jgi:hypothetical protein